ncbi:hypothetical protein LXA43DRAFT_876186 [Ganoderma leucocontextum]|nr:hypothetical protein LXA43DRAFT_876186 [Ganoderma leucocontextum]
MMSPAPLASANPPLSYADRARKAQQNARSSAPQLPLSRSSSQGTSAIAQTPSTTSASRSNVSPSNPSRSSPPGPTSVDPRISTPATSSKPTSPPSADHSSDPKPNGDVNHHSDSVSSVPSTVTAQKQSSPPPVNVWNKRKEQLAATRALTQSQSSQLSQPSSSSVNSGLTAASSLSSPPPSSLDVSAAPSASASADISVKSSPTMAPLNINGHIATSNQYDDPFVVRPGRSPSILDSTPPSNVTPHAIDDAESWPEVGSAATLPTNVNNGRAEGKAKETGEEERGHERETSGSRKSEKPKWVPAPEELQFEGQRNHHARPRPHNSNPRQPGGPSGTTSSSSGQGSQQQSRTHSAAGRRQTPSHAGSVSHSQTQSRTGSVQSSPRHASIRGGGRRLPDESSGPVFVNRSLRSSATNSPSAFAQPQPLPAEFIPGVGLRPYVNTNVTHTQPAMLSAIPDSAISAAADLNPHAAYYHPLHGPPFGVSPYHSPRPAGSPYHSPRPAGSPANNPYPLPPMAYQGQPGMPPPMQMSGYATPPYPMYPPYGYGYGQPYMYWHTPGAPPPQTMSASPITHAQQSDGVPPPTMVVRPPPPHESDAVAGYRDVGFALPPPSEINRSGQGYGQGEERERGRRTRELSFGSIGAGTEGTSNSPSPARASPVLGSVPEGAALGLDVSGGQAVTPVHAEAGSAAAPAVEKEQKDVSKAPLGLLIGVAPGEPTPARIRSRTHSKGPVASAQAEFSTAGIAGEQASAATEDSALALAEAAKIIHVTDPLPETKWEFGTTRQTEGVADPQGEFPAPAGPPPVDPSGVGIPGANFGHMGPSYAGAPPFIPSVVIPGGPVNGIPSASSPSTYVPPRQPHSAAEDEWEVRDYGYGFGRGGPAQGYSQAPAMREDRHYRGGRDFQGDREQHYAGRPRRGSYSQGGYGYERGERGAYTGRRGRGLPGGYGGRGYQNRSYSRGAYSNQQSRQQMYVPPAQPPQQEVNEFYAPPMAPVPLTTYIPQAFEGYPYAPLPPPPPQAQNASSPGAPLPMPQSNVGFPLDPTRYYLLGQLEYYLSPQNLAQDFFLRQQMDARGWISIPLIASFNRVRTLTPDVQLVTDVLALSSMVEVRNGHVRMRQWQQFVLPTATLSQVEDDGGVSPQDPVARAPTVVGHLETNQNPDCEDEEEEDVVFVL